MNTNVRLAVVILAALTVIGCSSSPKVNRVHRDSVIDLSGKWNDTDARMASRELIQDCLAQPWLENFMKAQGRNPMVIVGDIVNRTSEHVNTQVVTKEWEYALLQSGRVQFVASPEERGQVRAEREDQNKGGLTNPATAAAMGQETCAEFMLIGTLNDVIDEVKRKSVVFYQVNLELIDMKTNAKVWFGQKEIKKQVTKPRFSL